MDVSGAGLTSTDKLLEEGVSAAFATKIVKQGDIVVLTAGLPGGVSGTTNLIKAQQI
jgi:pyruvate kinase